MPAITATNWFRQHETAPALTSALLRQLCEEWTLLNASFVINDELLAWAQTYSCLEGLSSPGAVVDHIDQAAKPAKDEIMRALLALLLNGSQLAGRVLLQAMLPALCDLAARHLAPRSESGHDESLQRVITEFWSVIVRDRQLPRPGVAGRLWMDTLKQVTSHRRSSDAWEEHTWYSDDQDHEDTADVSAAQEVVAASGVEGGFSAEGDLLQLLVSARDAGVLSAEETRFLAEVYHSPTKGATLANAAQRMGMPAATLRQRCNRLKNRLVAAVLAERDSLELAAA